MRFGACILLLIVAITISAQGPTSAAPPDKPQRVSDRQLAQFEEAIKPHVGAALKTYPDAKARFEAGLPEGHSFYLTTRLREPDGKFEQAFIAVTEARDGVVYGKVWSKIIHVKRFKFGDSYKFPESEILDWMITRPDGSEEGNFVGKFLDTYQASTTKRSTKAREKCAVIFEDESGKVQSVLLPSLIVLALPDEAPFVLPTDSPHHVKMIQCGRSAYSGT